MVSTLPKATVTSSIAAPARSDAAPQGAEEEVTVACVAKRIQESHLASQLQIRGGILAMEADWLT